ncbi:MAG: MFS transporter [Gammaproteobacteria bacterium]|nr:MFS transporter [Gammaproteobacteria bacterium]
MGLITSFFALFLSVILLQMSSGGVGPLDALSGIKLNFSTQQIGLLGSAHFFGFFIGCWWAPRLMGSVGHSRAFATFTIAGAIGLLAHMMIVDPYAWAMMRVASGLCIAGCYTVIEAWLNARVNNHNRGRATGSYRIVDTGASMVAQLLVAVLEPADYISYNVLALLCCASLLPLTLTRARQPETPDAPRLRPGLAWFCSPLAVAGVMVAALSSASFRMVGPIYGENVGLLNNQIAYFLAAYVAGGAIAQYPAGWLADRFDRRWVLVGLSVAAILSCGITVLASTGGTTTVMTAAVIFGMTTFPIFSVSAAHANDFATNEQRVELSAALMFFYAAGAIASPYASSALITMFGPKALFAFIAISHIMLVIFSLQRMSKRATVTERTPYVYVPRSSFTIGRLLSKLRERK